MTGRISWAAAIAATALALGSACAAHATIMVTTFQGYVSSGVDGIGLFGSQGGSLAGKTFTATFVSDDSRSGAVVFDNAVSSGVTCTNSPVTCHALSASISINGNEIPMLQDVYDGRLDHSNVPMGTYEKYSQIIGGSRQEASDYLEFDDQTQVYDILISLIGMVSTENGGMYGDLEYKTPFDYQVVAGDTTYGRFLYQRTDRDTGVLEKTDIFLTTASVKSTVEQVSPIGWSHGSVPEPSSWALMLGGFMAVGAAMRASRARSMVKA